MLVCQGRCQCRHACSGAPLQQGLHGSGRRWRKLEGSDPTTYEMILKVQALQRRLIGQTEAVAERELHIAEQSSSLAELKVRLARQPGPEAVEQLGGMQARRSACLSKEVLGSPLRPGCVRN